MLSEERLLPCVGPGLGGTRAGEGSTFPPGDRKGRPREGLWLWSGHARSAVRGAGVGGNGLWLVGFEARVEHLLRVRHSPAWAPSPPAASGWAGCSREASALTWRPGWPLGRQHPG